MEIEVIQLSGSDYFWLLRDVEKIYAYSCLIGLRENVVQEAEKIAGELLLASPFISERRSSDA